MSDLPAGLSRRAFLRGCSAAVLAVPLATLLPDVAVGAPPGLPGVAVRPRSDWAAAIPAPGPLEQEAAGDVRFLIVHHSASTNGYAAGDVPSVIRGFHALHTGPQKRWPDIAYNFLVDRYGVIWEGRAGSLTGPVKPDATGGSQGFSQICCFVGDHTAEPPTAEAQESMTLLLAALAERYGIDPTPEATVTFVSRGSNKWPAGATVTASTIAGHRDMSLTTCPGDAAYPLVTQTFPAAVVAVLAARATPPPAPVSEPAASASVPPSHPQAPSTSGRPPAAGRESAADDGGWDAVTVALVAAGVAVAGAAAGLRQRARRSSGSASDGDDPGDSGLPTATP